MNKPGELEKPLKEELERLRIRVAELEQLATTDGLTGALNRRRFFELADNELARYHRYKRPLAFIMIDVDHFRRINEEHGHQIGDQILRGFAGVVQRQIRKNDVFGRLGNDEWGLMLPETRLPGALDMCERIREECAQIVLEAEQRPLSVTVSIGVTEVTKDNQTIDELCRRAEAALARARSKGGNRVEGVYV
jgi:diguanylate cyclase (GGDEF)-like protein